MNNKQIRNDKRIRKEGIMRSFAFIMAAIGHSRLVQGYASMDRQCTMVLPVLSLLTRPEHHWFHWLDLSAMGSSCIGALPSQNKRWKSIQPSDSGTACSFGLKITKDTAVISSDIYQRRRKLCLTLRFSPRCVHCRLLASRRDLSPLPHNTSNY
jgi:hypothetical protein